MGRHLAGCTCARAGAVRLRRRRLGPPPAFPRAPLLRPGQLTVNPAAAGGDVHFLGEQDDGAFPFTQSDGERALFLDFRGWWEEGEPPEFGNEPGKVQETTQNRWAFVERLMQSWAPWRPEDPAEPIPPDVAMMEPFRRRLSADVHDWQSLAVAASQVDPDLISMLSKIASHAGNTNLWFIFYHFFYPAHEENLRWCEFVALLNNLHKELPPASTLLPASILAEAWATWSACIAPITPATGARCASSCGAAGMDAHSRRNAGAAGG